MFKVFKLTKNHLPEVKEIVTLEQMIPTEKIGHSIEMLFLPISQTNYIKTRFTFGQRRHVLRVS